MLLGERGRQQLPEGSRPALLVSFFYLRPFLEKRARWAIRDWVMDSGAFSAANAGARIDLVEFTDTALRLLAEDPQLSEVYSLDVIGGDWRETARNTEYMWGRGVPAIPAWHKGEPWDVLEGYAKEAKHPIFPTEEGMRGVEIPIRTAPLLNHHEHWHHDPYKIGKVISDCCLPAFH